MGLFERQPIHNETPLYTIGEKETYLIVGLGNIGKEFTDTRHNLGFMSIDYFAKKYSFSGWINKKNLFAHEATGQIDGNRVILAKPTTMMNESGKAVQALQKFYRVPDDKTLVLHDDIDVDFGKIRIRMGGSDAGNNGIKSLIKHGVGNTWRARLGIGPKTPEQIDSYDFVLGKFKAKDKKNLEKVIKGAGIIANEFIYQKAKITSETRNFL